MEFNLESNTVLVANTAMNIDWELTSKAIDYYTKYLQTYHGRKTKLTALSDIKQNGAKYVLTTINPLQPINNGQVILDIDWNAPVEPQFFKHK